MNCTKCGTRLVKEKEDPENSTYDRSLHCPECDTEHDYDDWKPKTSPFKMVVRLALITALVLTWYILTK
jgi:hypothetical protein